MTDIVLFLFFFDKPNIFVQKDRYIFFNS